MQSGHTDSANFEECEISFFALGYFAPPAGILMRPVSRGPPPGPRETSPSQKVYFHGGRSIPPGGPDLLRGPPVSSGLSRPVEPAGRQGRDADRPRPVIRRLRPGFSVQSKGERHAFPHVFPLCKIHCAQIFGPPRWGGPTVNQVTAPLCGCGGPSIALCWTNRFTERLLCVMFPL